MSNYFDKIAKVNYEGANSTNPFAFKHYNPNEVILGKTVEEHLRHGSLLLAHVLLDR